MPVDFSKLKYLPKTLPGSQLHFFNSLLAIFILSFCALILGLYMNSTVSQPRAGGSHTEGVVGRPRLINPLYADSNAPDRDLVKLTYAGLIKFNGAELIGDLAENWVISDDQKEYVFRVRPDIHWPDGQPFDAQDVIFTFNILQNPRYQSPLMASFSGIQVTAPDAQTVKFVLPKPLTPFLESLSIGILPEHIWNNIPPESVSLTDFNIQPMGLGPYKFKKLVKDKFGTIRSYTLEPNENYHLGAPFIKGVTFRYYGSIEEALTGWQKKEVSSLAWLPQGHLQEANTSRIELHSLQLPQYTAIFFNITANAKIADKNIRQALALALDKEKILDEAIKGEGQIIHGPILNGYPGYHQDIEKFPFDPAAAEKLLDESGWSVLSDNNFRSNTKSEPLSLKLTTADTPELVLAAKIIQTAWQDIGVQTELEVVGTSAIEGSVISPRRFDVLLFGEIVGYDPDPYPFWHSSQISTTGLNLSNFKHSQADQVLADARETPDLQKKAEKYIHFQNILVAEIPAIFLYNPYYLYPLSDKIKGLEQTRIINPSDRLANINKWYIERKRVFK